MTLPNAGLPDDSRSADDRHADPVADPQAAGMGLSIDDSSRPGRSAEQPPPPSGSGPDGESLDDQMVLEPAIHRRLTVAVCWAVSRRAALDGRELFEESFALNEEFREWLLCLEDHPRELQASVLMVPRDLARRLGEERRPESDGLLEI